MTSLLPTPNGEEPEKIFDYAEAQGKIIHEHTLI